MRGACRDMFRIMLLFSALSAALIPQISFAEQTSSPTKSVSPETAMRHAEIQAVEKSLPKIADHGAALFFLAKRYAQIGDLDKGLALLKECIALDQGFDPSEAPQFEALRSDPEFQALVERVHQRYAPVDRARVAFTISETDLFPEGLALDVDRNVFYMGSAKQKIVRITEAGKVSEFVEPGAYRFQGLNGNKVDSKDQGLWVASADENSSELLHFDPRGKLLEHFPPPGGGRHALNDLVLHGPREIYVTDTLAHQVYCFDREQHRLPRYYFTVPCSIRMASRCEITVSFSTSPIFWVRSRLISKTNKRAKSIPAGTACLPELMASIGTKEASLESNTATAPIAWRVGSSHPMG